MKLFTYWKRGLRGIIFLTVLLVLDNILRQGIAFRVEDEQTAWNIYLAFWVVFGPWVSYVVSSMCFEGFIPMPSPESLEERQKRMYDEYLERATNR